MFRVLTHHAVKAAPRPSRLSTGTASRHVQARYTGLPSYVTVGRRFPSSQHDPKAHFGGKRLQEDEERGEHVGIRGVDPGDYDVLISDVDDERLRGEVAETVGIPYHAKATTEDASKVVKVGDCYIYGPRSRTIFPAVVARGAQAHWVFFLVDFVSPLTYLSAQTSDLFNITVERIGPAHVRIAGYDHAVHKSLNHLHFTEVNVLGMDFCRLYGVSQLNDFKKDRAKLFFGEIATPVINQ